LLEPVRNTACGQTRSEIWEDANTVSTGDPERLAAVAALADADAGALAGQLFSAGGWSHAWGKRGRSARVSPQRIRRPLAHHGNMEPKEGNFSCLLLNCLINKILRRRPGEDLNLRSFAYESKAYVQ
jgi:hypothetical protein